MQAGDLELDPSALHFLLSLCLAEKMEAMSPT